MTHQFVVIYVVPGNYMLMFLILQSGNTQDCCDICSGGSGGQELHPLQLWC